ncbi:hypothetical protein Csa_002165 [Cucumis sativus]|uniref:Uncharacterized protein n=1 Tax=Cucumis sativus TaxID=3659 RepID=A0A0A0LDT4_CUCSA|nr:hypothetical protein Csa_002165 [Cucumis sativus]
MDTKWGLRDLVIGMRGSADLWYYCLRFPLVIGCLLLCKWRLTLDLDLYKSYEQAGSH